MFRALDGPSLQSQENVSDSTIFRVKAGASELDSRSVVTILPLDGKIWVFFGDGSTIPTAQNVKDNGFPQFKMSLRSYEASDSQEMYIVSDSGTVDVRFAERS